MPYRNTCAVLTLALLSSTAFGEMPRSQWNRYIDYVKTATLGAFVGVAEQEVYQYFTTESDDENAPTTETKDTSSEESSGKTENTITRQSNELETKTRSEHTYTLTDNVGSTTGASSGQSSNDTANAHTSASTGNRDETNGTLSKTNNEDTATPQKACTYFMTSLKHQSPSKTGVITSGVSALADVAASNTRKYVAPNLSTNEFKTTLITGRAAAVVAYILSNYCRQKESDASSALTSNSYGIIAGAPMIFISPLTINTDKEQFTVLGCDLSDYVFNKR